MPLGITKKIRFNMASYGNDGDDNDHVDDNDDGDVKKVMM